MEPCSLYISTEISNPVWNPGIFEHMKSIPAHGVPKFLFYTYVEYTFYIPGNEIGQLLDVDSLVNENKAEERCVNCSRTIMEHTGFEMAKCLQDIKAFDGKEMDEFVCGGRKPNETEQPEPVGLYPKADAEELAKLRSDLSILRATNAALTNRSDCTENENNKLRAELARVKEESEYEVVNLRNALAESERRREEAARKVEKLSQELNWQNNRNASHPTKGGFEFYINEEWTGLANAAMDTDPGWHAALRKKRMDPDDERVRVRRVIEDDALIAALSALQGKMETIQAAWTRLEPKILERECRCHPEQTGTCCNRCYVVQEMRSALSTKDANQSAPPAKSQPLVNEMELARKAHDTYLRSLFRTYSLLGESLERFMARMELLTWDELIQSKDEEHISTKKAWIAVGKACYPQFN